MKKSIAVLVLLYAAVFAHFKDSRDGKIYRTVKIGTQTWMAENLNYKTGNSWCYGNSESNCQKYGRLYDWKTALKACPKGWHLPSNEEWGNLITHSYDPRKLRAKNGWNEKGTDAYGFSALPGGSRAAKGNFNHVGNAGFCWSSTEYGARNAFFWNGLDDPSSGTEVEFVTTYKGDGLSVRCLEDKRENGEWEEFDEKGNLIRVENYKDGKPEGEWKTFDINGNLQFVINYKDGKLDGEYKMFDQSGKLIMTKIYKDGVEVR
jgi:uncharacterized protein (TIGR02145 family)